MFVIGLWVDVGVGVDVDVDVGVEAVSAVSLPCGFAGGDEWWGVMWRCQWSLLWAGPVFAPLAVAPPDGEVLCGGVVSRDCGG